LIDFAVTLGCFSLSFKKYGRLFHSRIAKHVSIIKVKTAYFKSSCKPYPALDASETFLAQTHAALVCFTYRLLMAAS